MAAEAALRPTSALAQNANFVDTTSNQSIGGIKTFTQSPVVPAGTFALTQVPGTAMVAAATTGPFAPLSPGASAPTRYVGGTALGAPTAGTFAMGDFVIDQTAKVWICTVAGSPGTWVRVGGVDLTGNQTVGGIKTFNDAPVVPADAFPQAAVAGLVADLAARAPAAGPFAPSTPGATAATRYVGGTAAGAPTTGTFAVGDFVIDQTAKVWICTVAGSPGTWAQQSGSGVDLTTDQIVGGVKTFAAAPVVPSGAFPQAAVNGLVADLAAKAPNAGPFAPTSPGATAGTRYVGGTASGAPITGGFVVGDFVIDQTGIVWICTAAGTPGAWVQQSQSGVDLTNNQTVGGIKSFVSAPVVPADSFPETAVAGLVADLAAKQDTIVTGSYVEASGGTTGSPVLTPPTGSMVGLTLQAAPSQTATLFQLVRPDGLVAREIGILGDTHGTAGVLSSNGAMWLREYKTYGNEASFWECGGGLNPFNGQQDDVYYFAGYNRVAGSAKVVAGVPSFGLHLEAHVYDDGDDRPGLTHAFEYNFDYLNAAGSQGHRFMAFRADRSDPSVYSRWTFSISNTGSPGNFRVQNVSGSRGALFEVSADGNVTCAGTLTPTGVLTTLAGIVSGGSAPLTMGYPGVAGTFAYAGGKLMITSPDTSITPFVLRQALAAQTVSLMKVLNSAGTTTLAELSHDGRYLGRIGTSAPGHGFSGREDTGIFYDSATGKLGWMVHNVERFSWVATEGALRIARGAVPATPAGAAIYVTGGNLKIKNAEGPGNVFDTTKRSAYTQTYMTPDKTHAARTAKAVETMPATNMSPYGFTTQAQADDIIAQLNALRADHLDTAQVVNALIDDLQAAGLVG